MYVNKKGKYSTFFPDSWDMRKIRNEVDAAYIKALNTGFKGTGTVTVHGPSGFKILIQAENGVITRTHPVL